MFPERRADGSLSVVACFALTRADDEVVLTRWADEWITDRDARCGWDVAADGVSLRVDVAVPGELRIVIDADARSVRGRTCSSRLRTRRRRRLACAASASSTR